MGLLTNLFLPRKFPTSGSREAIIHPDGDMKDFLWCNTAKILWRKCQMSDHIYKHLSWFPRRLGRKCQMIRMIFPRHVALAPVIRRHVKDFKSANANTRQRQWWYSYFLDMLGIPLVSIIVAAHSAAVSYKNRWTDDVMCSMCLQTNDYVRAQLTHNWHLACRRSYFQDMSPFPILAPFWQIDTCPHY